MRQRNKRRKKTTANATPSAFMWCATAPSFGDTETGNHLRAVGLTLRDRNERTTTASTAFEQVCPILSSIILLGSCCER
eukprot:2007664-Alexandrium_andersonii.AAC.1